MIGGLAFVVVLIIVAVLYRRRLREVRQLREVNGMLSRELAAATARVEVLERMQGH